MTEMSYMKISSFKEIAIQQYNLRCLALDPWVENTFSCLLYNHSSFLIYIKECCGLFW